jgi:protein-S-isoprenylcysteine O-methyltransferase Ste14
MLIVMGALLFVPAGTLRYGQAWVFLALYGGLGLATTLYLMKDDRSLLERRMRSGPRAEERASQKIIMSLAQAAFVALLVVPALDHRWHWSVVPAYAVFGGDVLVALGWTIILLVLRENTFGSATIELAPEQRVVSTGPYAQVRHPMYAGALILLLGIPIALGSWWGLLAIAPMLAALILRLLDEERFLAKNLPGYSEYREKVKYRLVPFIW